MLAFPPQRLCSTYQPAAACGNLSFEGFLLNFCVLCEKCFYSVRKRLKGDALLEDQIKHEIVIDDKKRYDGSAKL